MSIKHHKRKILNKVYTLQIPFIENKGQIKDESVRYYAKTFGGTVFVTKDGKLVYSLPKFDVFVSKLNSSLSTLLASTFIGGSGGDCGWVLAVLQS